MSTKLNFSDVKKFFEDNGYKLLSTEYKRSSEKLKYKCPNNHIHEMSWDNFKQGKRCPTCKREINNKAKKKDFNVIIKTFKERGYTLLSNKEEYKNAQSKLRYRCPNGHEHSICWNSFNNGNGCPICATESTKTKLKLNFSKVKDGFEKEGYIVLSKEDEYINNTSKIKAICNNGHECEISWSNFQQGKRCRECAIKGNSEKQKLDYSIIENAFKEANYLLLTKEEEYTNRRSELHYVCDNGHKEVTNWANFKEGCRCPKCTSSRGEKKIISYLKNNNIEFIYNTQIWEENNLRPDFYLPKYNLVIEYDGKQHFEPVPHFGGKESYNLTKERDKQKEIYCKENNISLLRLPYWEYDNIENLINQEIEKLKTFND